MMGNVFGFGMTFIWLLHCYMVHGQDIDLHLSKKTPTVCSLQGCVHGTFMRGNQITEFEAFLGIPYAQPPLGNLRFKEPKRVPRWWGFRDANIVKQDCIQKNYLLPSPVVSGVEDCLYLNIYRPKGTNRSAKLPVMVYIFGGGWFSGSASPDIHGPHYFMDTEEVIFVTFAYRLGAFGFLSTNDDNMPGNFGLKDQNLALRWVQDNIAAFGGNPKKVTIFGQSAGAISAHMHMLSSQSDGLFHNLIALSGTANVPFAITEQPLEQARKIAELCNITNAMEMSTAKLVRALRQIDAEVLVNAGDGLKYWDVDHMTNFRPVVEQSGRKDAFLTAHPKTILSSGMYKAVPWMASIVPNEGAVRALAILENDELRRDFNLQFEYLFEKLMELPHQYETSYRKEAIARILNEYFKGAKELNVATAQGFLDVITDRGFHQPYLNAVRDYVNTMDTNKYPLYLYMFNYSGPYSFSNLFTGGQISKQYGVVHCDDLIYLFRSIFFPQFEQNSTEAQVIRTYVRTLVHFAKHGKPPRAVPVASCSSSPSNSSNNCESVHMMNLQPHYFKVKMSEQLNAKRLQLWNDILNESEKDYSWRQTKV